MQGSACVKLVCVARTDSKYVKRRDVKFSNTSWVGIFLFFALVAAACSSSTATSEASSDTSEQQDSSEQEGDSEQQDSTADSRLPQAFELAVVDTHPSGTQAQLREMTFDRLRTTVVVQLVNGREFDTTLRFEDAETSIIDAAGTSYPAQEVVNFELRETEIVDLELRFEPIDPDAGPFQVRVNWTDDDEGFDEPSPGFEFADVDVDDDVIALPADFGIADTASHEFGMQVRIFGMAFTETSIGLAVEVINNGPQRAAFNSGRYQGFLEDDLGNRYWLEIAPGAYQLQIEDGERQPGVLVYAGRIDPNATSVFGVLNFEGDDDGRSLRPRMGFGPYNLDGSTPPVGGDLNPITQTDQLTHPNGANVTMRGITFTETGTVVSLLAENDARTVSIRLALAGKSFLLDDLGNEYAILPPDDNQSLEIPGQAGLDADLSFPGAINLDATTIEVVFNDGEDEERDPASSGFPEVRFGPYPISRAEAVPGQPPSPVPAITTMGIEQLDVSEATPLSLIFDEFDGRLVPGGVLLTLPQNILFDSGSSTLRAESGEAIGKIIQITEFYTGDPMTVIGHTDSDGDDASNQTLSEARAQSVVDALITDGANAALLSAEGRGETEPAQTNDTEEGKQANRRVDIFFETDKGLPE